MRLLNLSVCIALLAIIFPYDGNARINPETSGQDIRTTTASAQSDVSLKQSCREQWAGKRAYNVEFCKKKCAAGEKRFCACAKNPCEKHEKDFTEEARRAAEKKAEAPLSSPPPSNEAQESCNMPAFKRPDVPMDKVPRASREQAKWLMTMCETTSDPNNVRYCHKLCFVYTQNDEAWRPYCNYCAVGYKDDCPAKCNPNGCDLSGGFYNWWNQHTMPWTEVKRICDSGVGRNRQGAMVSSPANMWACKALCDKGCKKYCDFCALGYGNPPTNRDGAIIGQAEAHCGEGKRPGVGVPGVPEGYGYATSGVIQKYWKGMFAELGFVNWVALDNAFKAGALGNPDEWSGRPTLAEVAWLAVNEPRRGSFYRKWWHEAKEGGLPTNPILIIGEDTHRYGQSGVTLKPGLHSYPNLTVWGWPVWIDYRP